MLFYFKQLFYIELTLSYMIKVRTVWACCDEFEAFTKFALVVFQAPMFTRRSTCPNS